ncbi:hypothetical protein [Salsipaludibacter albus]|uniref:hypothetical protein n=1 Tax=Salsipaludibacter albus TaxID=2849650 RepID=UPI001EE3D4ED|nr:hypothetical protein [Salsipaludibacter albus]MBY5163783.1 hypothetical protein [Salsipaludibacter albus]
MSDMPIDPNMAADLGGQPTGQPSEEEVRQYLAQMRGAPVEQVLAEVLQGLLNAAQIKLGRRDGRLLLDTATALVEQSRPALSSDLAGQVDEALSQLKMAQVEAEKEVAEAGREEPNDLGGSAGDGGAGADDATEPTTPDQQATPRQAPGGQQPGAQQRGQQPGGNSPLDKLWIPGR